LKCVISQYAENHTVAAEKSAISATIFNVNLCKSLAFEENRRYLWVVIRE
jgi:hypothetical protein